MPRGLKIPRGGSKPALHEPPGNVIMAQHQIAICMPEVVERGLADDGVAGDQLVSRHRRHRAL